MRTPVRGRPRLRWRGAEFCRGKTCKHLRAPYRDRQPAGSSSERKHGAFNQKLADDAPSTRAECRANRDFAMAACGAGKKKIRDIGTSDQEHQRDGAEKNVELRADVPDERVECGNGAEAHEGVGVGILCREISTDDACFLVSLFECHAWLQARDHVEKMRSTFVRIWLLPIDRRGERGKRGPQGTRLRVDREHEIRRHHTDDRVAAAVDGDRVSNDAGIVVKLALPQLMAEDYDESAGPVFVRRECTA